MIFWGPKKITSFIVDVRSTHDKPCRWDVLVLEELIMSVSTVASERNARFVDRNETFPWFETRWCAGLSSTQHYHD